MDSKPQSIEALIDALDKQTYQRLKSAIEVGKWESGERLSREQLANCMQLVIAYEHRNVPLDQRAGFVSTPGDDCEVSPDAIASDRKGETRE